MNRREIALALGGFVATAELPTVGISAAPAATGSEGNAGPAPARPKVGLLVDPDLLLLDLVGPQTILSIAMAEIHLIGKTRDPVVTDVGIPIGPTATFADSPANLDILFVPGRLGGTVKLMRDREVLDFLADHGRRARYVTSVCTGSLLLAAAGLLRGYRAASQWYVRDLLPLMGADHGDRPGGRRPQPHHRRRRHRRTGFRADSRSRFARGRHGAADSAFARIRAETPLRRR